MSTTASVNLTKKMVNGRENVEQERGTTDTNNQEHADKTPMNCPNKHIMKLYIKSLPDYFSDDEDVNCDMCNKEKINRGRFYYCQECGYDVCKDCAQSLGKYVKYILLYILLYNIYIIIYIIIYIGQPLKKQRKLKDEAVRNMSDKERIAYYRSQWTEEEKQAYNFLEEKKKGISEFRYRCGIKNDHCSRFYWSIR